MSTFLKTNMNLHIEKVSNMSKVTQLIGGRAGSRTLVSWFLNHSFNVDIEKENIKTMIKPVLVQRNDATPSPNYDPMIQLLFLSFFLFLLSASTFFLIHQLYIQGLPSVLLPWKKLGRKTRLCSWFLPPQADVAGCTMICWAPCGHLGKFSNWGMLRSSACQALPVQHHRQLQILRNCSILPKKSGCLRKLLNNYVLFATVILVIEGSERRISNSGCRRGWDGNGDVKTSCKAESWKEHCMWLDEDRGRIFWEEWAPRVKTLKNKRTGQ